MTADGPPIPPATRRRVLAGTGCVVPLLTGCSALLPCEEVGPSPVLLDNRPEGEGTGTDSSPPERDVTVEIRRSEEVVFSLDVALSKWLVEYDEALPRACAGTEFEADVALSDVRTTETFQYETREGVVGFRLFVALHSSG